MTHTTQFTIGQQVNAIDCVDGLNHTAQVVKVTANTVTATVQYTRPGINGTTVTSEKNYFFTNQNGSFKTKYGTMTLVAMPVAAEKAAVTTGSVTTGSVATMCNGSDKYPVTISEVNGKKLTVSRTNNKGEKLQSRVFILNKNNEYYEKGSKHVYLMLGVTASYLDPSF